MVFAMKRIQVISISVGVIAIFGLVMAVLFPAGSSDLSRKLFQMERQGRNAHYLLLSETKSRGIALDAEFFKCYSNSTDFIAHMATKEEGDRQIAWKALRDGEGSRWIVACQNSMPGAEDFPLLMTANVNPALLCAVPESLDKTVPLGVSAGAERSILDDGYAIVVRRNGLVQTISKKHCTPRNIIGSAVSMTNGFSFSCLTSTGWTRVYSQSTCAGTDHGLLRLPQ